MRLGANRSFERMHIVGHFIWRQEANCVERLGSQIKGCVVVTAQTRIRQGFRRLHRFGSDYTPAVQPRSGAVSSTTTRVRRG